MRTLLFLLLCSTCFAGGVETEFFPTADTQIYKALPNNTYSTTGNLMTRWYNGGSHSQALIRFDVSGMPANATVTKATLVLDNHSSSPTATAPSSLKAVQAWFSWSTSSTWNSTPDTENLSGRTTVTPSGNTWNVTGFVNNWRSGQTNNGILMTQTSSASSSNEWQFSSMETSMDPRLEVEYTLNCTVGAIQGDVDQDGDVDFADFLILSDNYPMASGASWSDGDLDCNGTVDFSDFLCLAANYGYPNGPQTPPSQP